MSQSNIRGAEGYFGTALEGRVGSTLTYWLLLLYLVLIPLKFQVTWILVYVQLLLFGVLVLRVLGGLRSVDFTKTQLVVIGVLWITICITMVGSVVAEPRRNIDTLPQVSRFLIIGLAGAIELNSARRLRGILSVATAIAAVIGFLSVVNLFVPLHFAFTGSSRVLGPIEFITPRSLGIWMSFGSYGILAVIGASYAGMSLLRASAVHETESIGRIRAAAAIALAFILLGVYLGQSRSTILAFIVLAICGLGVAAFHPDSQLRFSFPAFPGGILAVGAATVVFKSSTILAAFVDANAASAAGRVDQYRFAFELMAQRPLFGWGWKYFGTAFGTSYTVHNLWLVIGVSLGLPVFLSWLYLFLRLSRDTFRLALSADHYANGLGVVGALMIVGATVELSLYPGFTPITAVLIGILMGIVGIVKPPGC